MRVCVCVRVFVRVCVSVLFWVCRCVGRYACLRCMVLCVSLMVAQVAIFDVHCFSINERERERERESFY